jgi:hypothetical protein
MPGSVRAGKSHSASSSALAFVSTPWYLKRGYVYFADGISGLGAAVLYLALWAGGDYYHLFSIGLTFGFMAAVTGCMIAMAVGRNSEPVAVMALLGGFAGHRRVDVLRSNALRHDENGRPRQIASRKENRRTPRSSRRRSGP